jgi:hypothetical protein
VRRRTHRTDETQRDIVAALRAGGVKVWCIGRPCDLLCRAGARLFLLDCDGVTKYRKRDKEQLENFEIWNVRIVKTPEEALRAAGVLA